MSDRCRAASGKGTELPTSLEMPCRGPAVRPTVGSPPTKSPDQSPVRQPRRTVAYPAILFCNCANDRTSVCRIRRGQMPHSPDNAQGDVGLSLSRRSGSIWRSSSFNVLDVPARSCTRSAPRASNLRFPHAPRRPNNYPLIGSAMCGGTAMRGNAGNSSRSIAATVAVVSGSIVRPIHVPASLIVDGPCFAP